MIRVLIVEDEPIAADAHQRYVQRVPGFEVAGVAHRCSEALRFQERDPVDLILLDLYLPDGHGLALCRALRAAGHTVDVIVITSARDLDTVRGAVSVGVVQYLLKPFTFGTLRGKLEQYARFRSSLDQPAGAVGQADVDRALSLLRGPGEAVLPKGMTTDTLAAVAQALRQAAEPLAAETVGRAAGVSRVTARRYLEHLVDSGLATCRSHYGQVGRPERRYRWAADERPAPDL
jgi:response regulator of citrate/malate metabolism